MDSVIRFIRDGLFPLIYMLLLWWGSSEAQHPQTEAPTKKTLAVVTKTIDDPKLIYGWGVAQNYFQLTAGIRR